MRRAVHCKFSRGNARRGRAPGRVRGGGGGEGESVRLDKNAPCSTARANAPRWDTNKYMLIKLCKII